MRDRTQSPVFLQKGTPKAFWGFYSKLLRLWRGTVPGKE